jgi:hypothetical protein
VVGAVELLLVLLDARGAMVRIASSIAMAGIDVPRCQGAPHAIWQALDARTLIMRHRRRAILGQQQ